MFNLDEKIASIERNILKDNFIAIFQELDRV